MEGLGKRLQDARTAKGLTLEEAARLTKIRPSRLGEIENEDFSNFASLAYAKGFLQIYGKFLQIDVSPYLEAFEESEGVTVDGYSYLQDNPAPKPSRPAAVRNTESRGSFWPLIIGVIVLVAGFSALKLLMEIRRINPQTSAAAASAAPSAITAAPVPPPTTAAPRALPADENGTSTAAVANSPTQLVAASANTPAATPEATAATPVFATPAAQPEVRRAEPVHPEDLAAGSAAVAAVNRVEIRPLKKTYIKVVVNNDDENPVFEQWISPSEGARQFRGEHISIRVLDRDAIEIRKNGKAVARGDADVTID